MNLTMKTLKFGTLLAVALCSPLLNSAYGDSFGLSSSTKILWETLTFTTAPGVSITWLPGSRNTSVSHFVSPRFYSSCCAEGTMHETQSSANWDAFSFSSQLAANADAQAAANDLMATTVAWPGVPPGKNVTDDLVFGREGAFIVTGSGNVTFSVDYILSVDRSIDAGMIPYPKFGSAAFSEVGLMLYIPYVKTFDSDHRSVTLPVVVNDSVTDTISQSGTATVQYDLSDGGTYWIRAYESSFVTITASEPSSFLSLGLGLSIIAAVGLRSKR